MNPNQLDCIDILHRKSYPFGLFDIQSSALAGSVCYFVAHLELLASFLFILV